MTRGVSANFSYGSFLNSVDPIPKANSLSFNKLGYVEINTSLPEVSPDLKLY